MRALRQTFVLTPAMKVAVGRSVVQPTTNFTYVIKSTNVYARATDTGNHRSCTECPEGNVTVFGRTFLKLKYTDITKNTYIQVVRLQG